MEPGGSAWGKGKLQLTALLYFGGGFLHVEPETGSILNDA